FVDESQEIYKRITRNLIELENAPAQGTRFDDLARGLHTLKGSAATLGLDELADLAHRMEDAVLPLRGSAQPLPPPLADALLKALDAWMARLRATVAKSELPDLGPARQLLAQTPVSEPAEVRRAEPVELEEPQTAEETSWRVSTRQVIELLHEVERLREVRLRIGER